MALETSHLSFRYQRHLPDLLSGIRFRLEPGERVGLTAPSGWGKSTLAKLLAGHLQPTKGRVTLDGHPLPRRGVCPVQLITQHPELAINPTWKMHQVLEEAAGLDPLIPSALGIRDEWKSRFPGELSGGELQRFCIARALGPGTRFVLADESTTMLDAVTQAQVWQVLLDEAEKRKLGLLVITHQPALAAYLCTRTVDLREINDASYLA